MTCAEIEILLCDYVDGTLPEPRKSELESHLGSCEACFELAEDVKGTLGFLERVAVPEPPAELMTRILHQAPAGRQPWWRRMFGSWAESVLTPRYVMGMAMTIISFSLIARPAMIPVRQLKPSDLDPVKVWTSVDDRVHRAWDQTVKYYENLRWVLEIQSRLKDWNEQELEAQKNAPAASNNEQNPSTKDKTDQKAAPDMNRARQ